MKFILNAQMAGKITKGHNQKLRVDIMEYLWLQITLITAEWRQIVQLLVIRPLSCCFHIQKTFWLVSQMALQPFPERLQLTWPQCRVSLTLGADTKLVWRLSRSSLTKITHLQYKHLSDAPPLTRSLKLIKVKILIKPWPPLDGYLSKLRWSMPNY